MWGLAFVECRRRFFTVSSSTPSRPALCRRPFGQCPLSFHRPCETCAFGPKKLRGIFSLQTSTLLLRPCLRLRRLLLLPTTVTGHPSSGYPIDNQHVRDTADASTPLFCRLRGRCVHGEAKI